MTTTNEVTDLLAQTEATPTAPIFDLVESLIRSIEVESADEAVLLSVRERINFLMEKIKMLDRLMDEATMRWIKCNHRSLWVGPVEYYVGPTKKEKCLSIRKAIEALAELAGEKPNPAALDIIADAMSANGLKPGKCKEFLAEMYLEHFKVEFVDGLHARGKPKPDPVKDENGNRLKALNHDFVD